MRRRHLFGLFAALAARPARALYDARPEPALAAVLGEWRGTLTYKDYSQPDRLVTLPTRLFVSALAPDEIALFYIYDDGPGKTVYSYERLRFEFASNTLVWISGASERTALVGRITGSDETGAVKRYVVDTTKDRALTRYIFELGAASLTLKKDEIDAAGQPQTRNRYAFTRPG